MRVGAASTDVAAHIFPDIVIRACMPFTDAGNGRHDLARCAVTALEGVMFDEGGLDCVHHAVGGLETFDRRDRAAFDLHRQGETAQYPLAIDVDGTGSALSVIAALLRSGQIGMLAKNIEQRCSYVELQIMALAIDLER
ncbi:hypothetical protein AGR1A_pAt20387 [Agrobacterium fabacearum CFBP 5771]|nr:hypothetical protein AGR1A_pAt20387 [Agrobacterium fabacearum CFBP 5771]